VAQGANYNAADGSAQGFMVGQAATSTALTQSPNPAAFGAPVTITATASPVAPATGTPTGTVQFKSRTTNLGAPVAMTGGVATMSVPFAMPNQGFSAVYSGDTNFTTSTGTLNLAVHFDHVVTTKAPSALTVSGGSWLLQGITVGTTLTVSPGTSVVILNSTIGSAVTANSPGAVAICGSTLRSTLTVTGATGFVLVGDPTDAGCAPNKVASALNLANNTGGVSLRSNQLLSTATVDNNAGGGLFPVDVNPVVADNKISSALGCTGNSPLPVNAGQLNTAPYKTGQCASL
jgi:hypothetical protein